MPATWISAMQCIREDEDVCLMWFDQANNYHEKRDREEFEDCG